MTEPKQLEQLVEERKKQAKDRKLHDKLAVILNNFGKDTYKYDHWGFSSEHTKQYTTGRLKVREITVGSKNFDSYGEYGSSSSTWTEVLSDDRVVYREENCYRSGGQLHYPITVYIPGKWEEQLERPYMEVMEKKREEEKQRKEREQEWKAEEKQRRADSLKRSFGL